MSLAKLLEWMGIRVRSTGANEEDVKRLCVPDERMASRSATETETERKLSFKFNFGAASTEPGVHVTRTVTKMESATNVPPELIEVLRVVLNGFPEVQAVYFMNMSKDGAEPQLTAALVLDGAGQMRSDEICQQLAAAMAAQYKASPPPIFHVVQNVIARAMQRAGLQPAFKR